MKDEATERLCALLAMDGMERFEAEDLQYDYQQAVIARVHGNVDEATMRWLVRGVSGVIECAFRIAELTLRFRMEEAVVVMHTRAPRCLRDRTCDVLGGYWCLCRPSALCGRELYQEWYRAGMEVSSLWASLKSYYQDAFQPGYNWEAVGG